MKLKFIPFSLLTVLTATLACTTPQKDGVTPGSTAPEGSTKASVTITTIAGTDTKKGFADGRGTAAQFLYPGQMVFDKNDNLFVIDQLVGYTGGSVIRKIDPTGNVTTLVKGLSAIADLCVDPRDGVTLYAIETGDQSKVPNGIFRISADGQITRLSGGAGLHGYQDGPLATAKFERPSGIAMDKTGNLYIADAGNYCVRKVNLGTNTVTTLAGQHLVDQTNCEYADGKGPAARFCAFDDLTIDGSGNVFVPDRMNHRLRKITPDGSTSTYIDIAGGGTMEGPLVNARVRYPYLAHYEPITDQLFLVTDSGSQLDVVTTTENFLVLSRHITKSDYVTSNTGNTHGYYGLAINKKGEVLFADKYNHCIRKATISWQ